MAYSQAQNRATQKYLAENMEQVRFWAPKGYKDKIKARAAELGISMTEYLKQLVDQDIER